MTQPRAEAAAVAPEATDDAAGLHMVDWESIPWELVRDGIVRKAFSGTGATVALHRLMPKHEPRPHKHAHEQIVYILAGHIRFHSATAALCSVPADCSTFRRT
jgi:quercetin dioxygenase-like cupin family protein